MAPVFSGCDQELMLFEPLDEFIAAWQAKRDGSLRGIVEVIEEVEANDDSE